MRSWVYDTKFASRKRRAGVLYLLKGKHAQLSPVARLERIT